MSELHKFLFEGLPVRGMLVRLTDSWKELQSRREPEAHYPPAVRQVLGEMAAAAVLMQSNIKFNGALVLQIFGDGPLKLAVVEVQQDLSYRATAKVVGEVAEDLSLQALLNAHGQGRCAITLDPKDKLPGQQPYQGVVPLYDEQGAPLQSVASIIEHYMLQSEQLKTRLVLGANDEIAAGMLIQHLPVQGEGNLGGSALAQESEEQGDAFNRAAILAGSLKTEELLGLDAETVLRRLFWQERLQRFEALTPRFACNCSRERVGSMLKGLGREEIDSVLAERGEVEIACDFCGAHYRFDAVDVGELFTAGARQAPGSRTVQ